MIDLLHSTRIMYYMQLDVYIWGNTSSPLKVKHCIYTHAHIQRDSLHSYIVHVNTHTHTHTSIHWMFIPEAAARVMEVSSMSILILLCQHFQHMYIHCRID